MIFREVDCVYKNSLNRSVNYIGRLQFDEVKQFLIDNKILNDYENVGEGFQMFQYSASPKAKIVMSIYNDKFDKIVVDSNNRKIMLLNFGSVGLNEQENKKWLCFLKNKFKQDYMIDYICHKSEQKHLKENSSTEKKEELIEFCV